MLYINPTSGIANPYQIGNPNQILPGQIGYGTQPGSSIPGQFGNPIFIPPSGSVTGGTSGDSGGSSGGGGEEFVPPQPGTKPPPGEDKPPEEPKDPVPVARGQVQTAGFGVFKYIL